MNPVLLDNASLGSFKLAIADQLRHCWPPQVACYPGLGGSDSDAGLQIVSGSLGAELAELAGTGTALRVAGCVPLMEYSRPEIKSNAGCKPPVRSNHAVRAAGGATY